MRVQRTELLLAASLLLAGSSGSATQPASAEAQTHAVSIENVQFSPARLRVRRGDKIVWVNKDLFPHTVTADHKAFDSGSIDAGASWSYVPGKPGEYSYSCTFHPTMHGVIEVQ